MPLGFGKGKKGKDDKLDISRSVSILKSRSNANEAEQLKLPISATPLMRSRSLEGLLEGKQ